MADILADFWAWFDYCFGGIFQLHNLFYVAVAAGLVYWAWYSVPRFSNVTLWRYPPSQLKILAAFVFVFVGFSLSVASAKEDWLAARFEDYSMCNDQKCKTKVIERVERRGYGESDILKNIPKNDYRSKFGLD